ncbi:MAG: methylated-DNA--[protein]-cysteine S-methyltransferase [Gammaproteobacteria bacterium]|nr:methylated-DNA--[protein]-cysteine S-methyltransferase [Gammaproteobacteria bacterium]
MRGGRALPKSSTFDEMDSPVGRLTIISSAEGLHAILWDSDRHSLRYEKTISDLIRSRDETTIVQTKEQLAEYFEGKRKIFDLPLIFNGTDFQIQAWKQLLRIPYAKTISYAEQAVEIGNKNKARAVGMANGLNPISIIVPCHRVIGSKGNLVGFGGGLDKKAFLLRLESEHQ